MIQETKVCSKCFKEKPIDAFRWLNTLGRYQARCKKCEREYMRKYNKSVPVDKRAEYAVTHKIKQMSAIKVLDLLTQQKETYMTQLKTLQTNIEQWAVDRDLHTGEPSRQIIRLIEKQGRLAVAIVRNSRTDMADAIGDLTVVAITLAKQLNASVDLWESFEDYMKFCGEKLEELQAIYELSGQISHLAAMFHHKKVDALRAIIEQVIARVVAAARTLDIDFIAAVQDAYEMIKDDE
jgi:uncharacterized 18.2 kDa protein in rep-hol intergenic region